MSSKGAFIVLIGPDGAGKTTLARNILTKTGDDGRYFHFIPTPLSDLQSTVPESPILIEKNRDSGLIVAGVLRILRSLCRAWIAYFRSIRPAVRSGSVVVGDRWLYGYVTQPLPLKYYGPGWLARLTLLLMPQPDLTVRLDAPPSTVRARKPELSLDEIGEESRIVEAAVPKALVVDATQTPEAMADLVLDRIAMSHGFARYPPLLNQVLLPVSTASLALIGSTLYAPVRSRGLVAHRLGRGLLRYLGTWWLMAAKPTDLPADDRVVEAIHSLLAEHRMHAEGLAFHRRTQSERPGFVVMALCADGPLGFIRVGRRGTLDVECKVLELLELHGATSFRVPRLIGRAEADEHDLALHTVVLEGLHRPPKDPPLEPMAREIKRALASLAKPAGFPDHWEPMHGDLTPWNLRDREGELSLIDWETAGWGPPGADTVYYIATARALGLAVRSDGWDAESAAFWVERVGTAKNRRDRRLRKGVLDVLASESTS